MNRNKVWQWYIQWKCALLVLSVRVCLYWPKIFCVKGLVLSACMYVLAFQDQHTLPKWNILSLLVYEQANRQNISPWEGVLVLEGQCIQAERTRPLTQNISGQYRHYTWAKREKQWISCHLIVRKDVAGLPFRNLVFLLLFRSFSKIKTNIVCVSEFLKLVIGNQTLRVVFGFQVWEIQFSSFWFLFGVIKAWK